MYALNISETGRILSTTFEKYAPSNAVLVETLPDGNIADYVYQNNELIYDPIPVVEEGLKPSQLDIIEAQVTYTAIMTDTLMEV